MAWLYDKESGERFGGLVCELSGNYPVEEIEEKLKESMQEIYQHGYDSYRLDDIQIFTETFVPHKQYGTALVALCFVSHLYPVKFKWDK